MKPKLLNYEQFSLAQTLSEDAKERLKNPNLHPLIAEVCCAKIIKEDHVEGLRRAGKGGFGDVFFVDQNFVVKRVLQYRKGMINPFEN